jgi:hypothetical protein
MSILLSSAPINWSIGYTTVVHTRGEVFLMFFRSCPIGQRKKQNNLQN